jgi:hypothetical protein
MCWHAGNSLLEVPQGRSKYVIMKGIDITDFPNY